jgi:hypothetical protein
MRKQNRRTIDSTVVVALPVRIERTTPRLGGECSIP